MLYPGKGYPKMLSWLYRTGSMRSTSWRRLLYGMCGVVVLKVPPATIHRRGAESHITKFGGGPTLGQMLVFIMPFSRMPLI